MTTAEIMAHRRETKGVRARWAIMLALHGAGWSYPRIARAVGRTDHTTARHGVERAQDLAQRCAQFRKLCLIAALPVQVMEALA